MHGEKIWEMEARLPSSRQAGETVLTTLRPATYTLYSADHIETITAIGRQFHYESVDDYDKCRLVFKRVLNHRDEVVLYPEQDLKTYLI